MNKHSTSWEKSAEWYQELLENKEGTYQKEVILPNVIRLLNPKKGERVLDLACGQGFFAREFFKAGASVIAADISPSLIELAKKNSPKGIDFKVTPAHKLGFLKDNTIDAVTIIMAVQNIENIDDVFRECGRTLKPGGRILLVMNHPAFRIPQKSDWGFDAEKNLQYRKVEEYLSSSKIKIDMHPGKATKDYTITFHHPLQVYFKFLNKAGFAVGKLEEWISHKKSSSGPRQKAEDKARKEIPLFLFMEAIKIR